MGSSDGVLPKIFLSHVTLCDALAPRSPLALKFIHGLSGSASSLLYRDVTGLHVGDTGILLPTVVYVYWPLVSLDSKTWMENGCIALSGLQKRNTIVFHSCQQRNLCRLPTNLTNSREECDRCDATLHLYIRTHYANLIFCYNIFFHWFIVFWEAHILTKLKLHQYMHPARITYLFKLIFRRQRTQERNKCKSLCWH